LTLNIFSESRYPAVVDILVVDGGITDRTKGIVNDWSRRDSRIRLLDNPFKFQSHALNIAIHSTTADLFVRADAHSIYAEDYIENCVAELLRTGALNVGGAPRFIANGLSQAGIALAAHSRLGSGGAKHRDENYDGFAETVFLGCFLRAALLSAGGYQKESVVNEDAELNLRLIKGSFSLQSPANQDSELNIVPGARKRNVIYVSSKIKVWYWPRRSFSTLVPQHFKYGRGRALTCFGHRYVHIRSAVLVSAWLSLALFAYVDMAVFDHGIAATLAIGVAVVAMVVLGAARIVASRRGQFAADIWRGAAERLPSEPKLVAANAASLIIMYTCYTVGLIFQTGRILLRRSVRW